MSDRYCINEGYSELIMYRMFYSYIKKIWTFEYNDGTVEVLTMREEIGK